MGGFFVTMEGGDPQKIGDDPKCAHALTTVQRGIDQHSPISLVTQNTIPSSHTHFPQITSCLNL